jgi:hypothetical protein
MPYSKYSKKQKRLAAVAPPRKKITGADLKGVRKRKKKGKKPLPKGYSAPAGSSREKQMRRAAALYKAGDKQAAYRIRRNMEEKERAKKSFKPKKAKYSKKSKRG